VVISNALGAADDKPPLHFGLEPSDGPFNKVLGRGTPVRTRAAAEALAMKDRVPAAVMRAAGESAVPPR
jgi:acyl-CoA dehydrogenase